MGTYLSLTLKDRTEENINKVNKIWNDENPGYEDTFHLNTEADIRADIEYIKTDPGQAHLRYLKTVKQWNKAFKLWGSGQFQVKITMGDYLCSEMARRYIQFLEAHGDLFVEYPDDYVMSILRETTETEHKAESCLVECQYCKSATPFALAAVQEKSMKARQQPVIGITERGDAGLNFYWEKEYGLQGCGGVILITKHLSTHFIERATEYNSIVHATITGHGGTVIEPNVPPADESVKLFGKLVETLGTDRVVLRIDPIIPTFSHVATAKKVYEALKGYNTRIRISFLDNYPHVKARFQAARLEPLKYGFHVPLASRMEIAGFFQGVKICGEPGMECTGCVSERDLRTLGIEPPESMGGFQRAACKCLAVKRELLKHRGQCESRCLYCYWK